ncbi:MAG: type II toxin-antitoxin system VapC family toxin, partial [Aquiluna sp.]
MELLVLDSSVWIAIERGVESEIQVLKEGFNILLPAMVAAELMPDPARIQPETNRHQRSLDFFAFVRREAEFAPFDEKVVEKYVQLISFCKREGQPRSIPDLMIAAT